jgi:hypothetical protein
MVENEYVVDKFFIFCKYTRLDNKQSYVWWASHGFNWIFIVWTIALNVFWIRMSHYALLRPRAPMLTVILSITYFLAHYYEWIIDLFKNFGLISKEEDDRSWGNGSAWFEMYVSVGEALEKFVHILWVIRVLYTATIFTEDQSKPIEVEDRSYTARFKRSWYRTFKDEIK